MNLSNPSRKGICPAGNYCEITAYPEGDPCGSTVNHLAVLMPAEKLCLRALDGYIASSIESIENSSLFNNAKQHALALESAWYGVEKALNNQTPTEEAGRHLDMVEAMATQLASDRGISFARKFEARKMGLYIPFYRNRVNNLPHSVRQRRILGEGLAGLYEDLLKAPIHSVKTHGMHLEAPDHVPCMAKESDRPTHMANIAVQMLALRTGQVFFQSSRRETRIEGIKGVESYRHQVYVLDGDTKYPIKIAYDGSTRMERLDEANKDTILHLSLDQIIRRGFAKYGKVISHKEARESVPQLAALLHAEIRGKKLTPDLEEFLEMTTAAMHESLSEFTGVFKQNVLEGQIDLSEESKVAWTRLSPRKWNDMLEGRTYGKGRSRRDPARLRKLDQLLKDWGGDGYPTAANLQSSGEYDYVTVVLNEKIGDLALQHAVAENPGVNNAMLVFRGETGVINGRVVRTWRDALQAPTKLRKSQAEYLGAHRIVHTVNADANLLDYLTRPILPRGAAD